MTSVLKYQVKWFTYSGKLLHKTKVTTTMTYKKNALYKCVL